MIMKEEIMNFIFQIFKTILITLNIVTAVILFLNSISSIYSGYNDNLILFMHDFVPVLILILFSIINIVILLSRKWNKIIVFNLINIILISMFYLTSNYDILIESFYILTILYILTIICSIINNKKGITSS